MPTSQNISQQILKAFSLAVTPRHSKEESDFNGVYTHLGDRNPSMERACDTTLSTTVPTTQRKEY